MGGVGGKYVKTVFVSSMRLARLTGTLAACCSSGWNSGAGLGGWNSGVVGEPAVRPSSEISGPISGALSLTSVPDHPPKESSEESLESSSRSRPNA